MSRITVLREIHKIQGKSGNWNFSPYGLGLYNGLELALAIVENRTPQYRDAPTAGYLVDRQNGNEGRLCQKSPMQ